jgi:hypothetical protein
MGTYNKIEYVTKNSKSIIKHHHSELINSDLKKLLPDLITDIHKDFLKTSLAFSQK